MNFGAMNEIGTFQQPGTAGYEDVERVPFALEMADSGAPESLQYGAPVGLGYFKIRTRFRSDVKAEWRLVHDDGRIFQVSSYGEPSRAPRRSELQIYATQIQ
jgi:head-tail adaptor